MQNWSEILVWLQGLGLWTVEVQASPCPVGPFTGTLAVKQEGNKTCT